jgi:hypothetical protein
MQDWMRRIAARGEVEAAREVLARSGQSAAQWSARLHRDFELARSAADAASGASP